MFKYIKDFTYKDLVDYGNKRACDGHWSIEIMSAFLSFYHSIPKGFKRKKNKYVKEHIGELFNLKDFPNMKIDIENGKIEVEE